MTPIICLSTPGPPCPHCGRELADHPDRWTLDDYVRGTTGRGPRIAARQVGGVKCPALFPGFDGDDPAGHDALRGRADWMKDRLKTQGL